MRTPLPNAKPDPQRSKVERAKPGTYEPPRILSKRAVERVTLSTYPINPGGGVGGE